MRWLFPDPDDREEAAARQKVLDRIDRWWEAFEGKTRALAALFEGKKQWDLPGWMEEHLQRINPHLMWEFGPAVRAAGHRLVITPESRTHLRPLVRAILDLAPEIPGWEFYPYRLAEDLDGAQATVEGRTGGTLDGMVAEVRAGEEHRVDLLFRSPDTADEDDEAARNTAFVAAETLLGEEALDKWVGAIEVGPLRGKARGTVSLDRVRDTFRALVDSIRDRLPGKPYVDQDGEAEWSLLRLEPRKARDYPGRADLLVAATRDVELFKAMHGRSFYSARFSRFKETFAYLKLDGATRRPGSEVEDREEIENALDAALARDGLGVHVGGGTGLRYTYIDLALTKRKRAAAVVQDTLRELGVAKRSWLLFHDADLAAEWVGVYPETPPPPMTDADE